MAINSINTVTAAAAASTQTTTKSAEKTSETTKKAASSKTASGVIYEKSSDSRTDKASNKTTSKTDNAAIVAKLKADAEQRTAQLRSIVEQMMTKQGVAIGTADDMWKFLAKGDFTVSADVKAQAQADIADDGYWGVEQTSDRILDFAKALSGDDPDKADAMRIFSIWERRTRRSHHNPCFFCFCHNIFCTSIQCLICDEVSTLRAVPASGSESF